MEKSSRERISMSVRTSSVSGHSNDKRNENPKKKPVNPLKQNAIIGVKWTEHRSDSKQPRECKLQIGITYPHILPEPIKTLIPTFQQVKGRNKQ